MIRTPLHKEQELVGKLKALDQKAFSLLYDRYSNALFGIICQLVSPQEAAEDVLQQVFVKIWKSIHLYDSSKGRLFTWMLNIARNQAIDHTRSRDFNRQNKTEPLTGTVHNSEAGDKTISGDPGLIRTLEKLPAEQRRLVELSYFLGYAHQEIAEMMELPLGTVKTRLRTAIIELRKILQKENN